MGFGLPQTFTTGEAKGFDPVEAKQESNEIEQEVVTNEPAQKAEEPKQAAKPEDKKTEEPKPIELNDDMVKEYFKNKYEKEVTSFEDLFKTPEKVVEEKIVNPYEDVLDEYDKAYLQYKKETGNSRREFDFIQQDLSKKSDLDFAIEKVKALDSGLSNAQITEYLESELNVDLSDSELSGTDIIKLKQFSKDYKDSQIELQEKYKKPLEKALANQKPKQEMVTLENGVTIPKENYEALVQQQNEFRKQLTESVNSVASSDFTIAIDDNGEKRNFDFSYEFSKEDKHSMLSDAMDVNQTIQKRFQTKDGFNHQGLAKALWFSDDANVQKFATSLYQKARAEALEEFIANGNNENFSQKPLQQQKSNNDGYGDLTGGTQQSGYGLKYAFSNAK